MRYWQYLAEIPVFLTLKEIPHSISLLKAAWTVLVNHVGNSTEVKINDGWIHKWYFSRMVSLLTDHT